MRVFAPPPVVIALSINVVMNVRIRDRCPEEVVSADCEPYLFANGREIFRPGNLNFEFRFLILLYFEVAGRFGFINGRRDVVVAKRSVSGNIEVATERATRRERQFLLKNFSVVRIFDRDVDSFGVQQLITVTAPLSQDAFKENLLRRTIDMPVAVDITG